MKEVSQQEYYTFLERYLGKVLTTSNTTDGVSWQHVGTNESIAEKRHRNGTPVYWITRTI